MEKKELDLKDLEAVNGGVKLNFEKKALAKDDQEPAIKPVVPKVLETQKAVPAKPVPTPLDPDPTKTSTI